MFQGDGSLGIPAVGALSSDSVRGARAVLNRAQPHHRAVRKVRADAVLVACLITTGTDHRQAAAARSRALAVQKLTHPPAEVARQEGVQQRVQAGVHVRDQEGRHGQQGAEVRRAVVIRAPMSPHDAHLLGQVAHGEHHHHGDQHSAKQRRELVV